MTSDPRLYPDGKLIDRSVWVVVDPFDFVTGQRLPGVQLDVEVRLGDR